jgi:carbon monoxide dehydrogenase subunit G
VDFQISVEVAAPPDIVWAVMADAERWHEWTPSVRSIRRIDSGPLRVGSRAVIRQPRFPPAMWKVTAIDPGRSFTWKSGGPGMWVYAQHSVDAVGSGARATLALHFDGAVGRMLGRMTRKINNRYLGLEATGLKRRSEELARAR